MTSVNIAGYQNAILMFLQNMFFLSAFKKYHAEGSDDSSQVVYEERIGPVIPNMASVCWPLNNFAPVML